MPPVRPELLDELLKDYQKPEDLLGQDGLLQHLIKALVERALDGELMHHSLFPNNEAVFKLMYLALRNISQRWTMPIKNSSAVLNQFAILFDGRVPMGGLNQNSLTQTA